MGAPAPRRDVLPFAARAREAAPAAVEAAPAPMPVQVGYLGGAAVGVGGESSPWAPQGAAAAAQGPSRGSAQGTEAWREETVAPPVMIGPVAKVEPKATAEEVLGAAREGQEGTKGAKASSELPLEAFPIERCAAIAASIARRKAEEARILEENGLEAGVWEKLDKHWNDAARRGMERGRPELLRAYDAAYVGQLEEERGPITLEEYARLVVAAERGNAWEVMMTMTLPREAMMRIERVWLVKLARDAREVTRVTMAVEVARSA